MSEKRMLRDWMTAPGQAAWHLVMCPFAGGSSGAFREWHGVADAEIDVSLVIYPGRDHRIREPAAASIDELADQLARELEQTCPKSDKLVLAGHSMGAQVAFETCIRLEQRGIAPYALVLSGCHAPHQQGRRLLSSLGDREFIEQLVEIGGNDASLQTDPSLLAIFLPMLRADFKATETYQRSLAIAQQPISTPTLLIYGSHDIEASRAEVSAWRDWLLKPDEPLVVPGDHFYVTRRPRSFLLRITRWLESIAIPI